MRLVGKNEKGVNLKLHPAQEDKIFTEPGDDGRDIVIVKGRIVRVDYVSSQAGTAIHNSTYPIDGDMANRSPLLVQTDESPTYVAPADITSVQSNHTVNLQVGEQTVNISSSDPETLQTLLNSLNIKKTAEIETGKTAGDGVGDDKTDHDGTTNKTAKTGSK
jgi:hypothetical protein